MTAKAQLNQIYWLDKQINSKLEQLSSLKKKATEDPNAHDIIARMIKLNKEIDADIDRLVDLKQEIAVRTPLKDQKGEKAS